MKRKNTEGATPYTCLNALRLGGTATRASALVMGLGNLVHKQYLKGVIFLLTEIAYIWFMIQSGFYNLQMLVTLGSVEQEEVWNEELQVYLYTQGDQSVLLLLYGKAPIAPNALPKKAVTSTILSKISAVSLMKIFTGC